ncbi:MAG: alpha/beta hydrolase [Candidatus Daviesbacteria bacterium]|nr:alpha/beta hydrolase [Candidatus Daviesbacteria bacterium]
MYIAVNNQNVYFQKVGTGPDLIMLHGWGQDVSSFWGVLDGLKTDFTIWLIDLPGFGRSDLPQKPFTVSNYVSVINSFIEENKIKKPILLGHSLGGRIALKLAAHYPETIDKLILEDAAGIKPKQDSLKPIFYLLAKIFKVFPDIFKLKTRLRHYFYSSLESDYLTAGEMKETLTKILAEDLTPDLSKIKTETLILWGEKDRAVPLKDGKKMYQLIANSRLEVIDEIGHFPHLEKPNLFIHYVKDFA